MRRVGNALLKQCLVGHFIFMLVQIFDANSGLSRLQARVSVLLLCSSGLDIIVW